jgi:acetyl-CoA acetyltransferase family protein
MAYIVDCVRTAGGKKGGKLSSIHPSDLGAHVLNAILDRNPKLPPSAVEDVIFGCVSQIGFQTANVARSIVLSSNLPITVPATTVDRQCGSGQQAIHFAAQAVMSGTHDIVIAGGIEIMSVLGIGDAIGKGKGNPWAGEKIQERYGQNVIFSQFEGAEIVATNYDISRKEMDELAVLSHNKAFHATQNGHFKNEIVPIIVKSKDGQEVTHDVDEGIRYPVNVEKLTSLPPLKKGGQISAGTSSQLCDGASAMLICNANALKKYGLIPRARVIAMTLAGSDPVEMLAAPIPASKLVLEKAGLTIDQIDLYEINEAFASVPCAWLKALKGDLNKLNVNGGSIALGHPLGSTGVKLMTTLLNEMERRGVRYGLQSICEGGGTANATIIERISTVSKL